MTQRRKALPQKKAEKGDAVYEPTPAEGEAIEAFKARENAKAPTPKIKLTESRPGVFSISVDHPDLGTGWLLLSQKLATNSIDFAYDILKQLVNAVTTGKKPDQGEVNFALAIINGIEPRDQVETLLAAQMAAVHMAIMTFARRLAHVENIPQQDSAERAFNKLARTFTAQMEALTRYRGKGQQKMTVEHVHVHQGGQAIVGNVNQEGGGVKNEK